MKITMDLKNKEEKTRTAPGLPEKKSGPGTAFSLIDNRPGAVRQVKLINAIGCSNPPLQPMYKSGKKGGTYFSRTGYTAEEVKEAEAQVGATSAHGSGKQGISGISGKAKNEEAKLIEVLRDNKAKKKSAKKSVAVPKGEAKKSFFEKAKIQASTTYKGNLGDFVEYLNKLEEKGASFTENELEELYQLVG